MITSSSTSAAMASRFYSRSGRELLSESCSATALIHKLLNLNCDFILRTTGADQSSSGRHRRRSTRASNGTRCHKNVILNGGEWRQNASKRIGRFAIVKV